jgi:hypothetical protein
MPQLWIVIFNKAENEEILTGKNKDHILWEFKEQGVVGDFYEFFGVY